MKKTVFCLSFLLLIFSSCNNVVRVNKTVNNENETIKESDLTESENYKGIKTCEEGQELAQKELKEGKLKYIFSSYGSRQNLPKKLESLYSIEIINTQGVLGIANSCYNDIMYKEIQRRFGKDAFNKAIE
jgi:hypothetical protein